MADQKNPSGVYNIVAFIFADTQRANQVVQEIKGAQKDAGFKVVVEAIVQRDANGNVSYAEPGKGGVGAVAGAAVGGVLGLFFGPAALLGLAIAGAIGGGVAGHLAGRVIPADDLKKFGASMPNNSSAFLVLLEDTEAEKAINALKGYNANVVTMTVGNEFSGEIGAAIAAEVDKTGKPASPAQAATQPATQKPAATEAGNKPKS